MKLYRAGEPTRGTAFWSASEAQARKLGPNLALHEAELASDARIVYANRRRTALENVGKDVDVVVFTAKDGTYEYVVINPHVLRIVQ